MIRRLPALSVIALALAFVGATSPSRAVAQTPAFPGAEGFGALASGGRGGDVYIVTNLNDSGTGSLRDGVTKRTTGVPRTIVFAVSGTIYLNSTLRITVGNLTIAGQTAPGDGICLARGSLDISGSNNVIIRFIRSRFGDALGIEGDAFSSRDASNVIIDHCSFSWSVDECASAYRNTNFTIQWSIASEALRDSVHSKGPHGYGGIWGGLGTSFHHNLLAHNDSRNPRFSGAGSHNTAGELVDFRNNVIYNWRINTTYGGEPTNSGLPSRQNVVNNYYKPGPVTPNNTLRYRVLNPSAAAAPEAGASPYGLFHVLGNHATASTTVTADNWNGGVQGPTAAQLVAMRINTAFTAPAVATQSALDAYPLVLAYAGCRLPVRDSVDTRVVSDVQQGIATFRGSKNNYPGIIDSQNDVGGWPALDSLPAPADSDNDGMPDTWELARGLNPGNAADRNLLDADGYTRLENYLNHLAAPAFPQPVFIQGPVDTTVGVGGTARLDAVVQSVADYTCQWFKDGVALPGATTTELTIANAGPADAGTYTLKVTSVYGSVTSAPATLASASPQPAILSGPASATVLSGQPHVLTLNATGAAPLTFQWYRAGGRAVSGATSATLTLTHPTTADAGGYYVVVANALGSLTSPTAWLTVNSGGTATLLDTDFATDTLHAATPVITATTTDWCVMSSKNATGSSVGDDAATTAIEARPLTLTMTQTTSGVVEAAGRLATTTRPLGQPGDAVRVQLVFVPTNVRTLGVGLFNSGGAAPAIGLANGQLSAGLTTFATGGAQHWRGYRTALTAASATPSFEARLAQTAANNTTQSLIIPGTSSSAGDVLAIGVASASAAPASFADGQTYTLSFTLTRNATGGFDFESLLHAGTDTSAPALFSSSSSTTVPGALPGSVAELFDAIALGYRNVNSDSVSQLRVLSLQVAQENSGALVRDAFGHFFLAHRLDPAATGAASADADHDGVANLLEFALGGDPTMADGPLMDVTTATIPGGSVLLLSYAQPLAVNDVLVELETSADLAHWTNRTNDPAVVRVVEPLDPGRERVTYVIPWSDASPRFARLRGQILAAPHPASPPS